MSLLLINYCMTCVEGLHLSAFHYLSATIFPPGYSPIIRRNKTSFLRITSLLSSGPSLFIGTSAGVVLTLSHPPQTHPSPAHLPLSQPSHSYPLQTLPLSPTSPPLLSHLPQGHTDSISFLCELTCSHQSLVLTGGTGYESFSTCNAVQDIAESASCLLIWRQASE